MASGDEQTAGEILRGLTRQLNFLNEDNRSRRKKSLEQIRKETVDRGLSGGVLQQLFCALLKPLLRCLSDPNDACREAAMELTAGFIRTVPKPEEALPYLMPCLAQRLGEKEIREPSEELRLAAVEALTLTVEVCGRHLVPYLSEMFSILQRTVVDPFPDVRRESCRCAVKFAESVPEHFHMQAESLVKPLMQTIAHQRYKVRVSVIEATGVVIQQGTGKNVDDVLLHMAQRLFDDSPQVRKAVASVIGGWLLHLRDRYSYFPKLIPLLLSSIDDEIPEIRLLAADLWRQVGAQWEKENEDDIKDKMDFLLTPPPFYPPGVERPGFGCRELVIRNLGSLVPAISNDMGDWLVATRVRTSRLLSVLLLHAEDHSTQHLQLILTTVYRACTDTERDMVNNCLAAARLLGTFVPPDAFLRLLLEHLVMPSSSSQPWTPLMVLAAMLSGCPGTLLKPHLQHIANTLTQPDVCQAYQQVIYLEQLLACVDALLCQCQSDCGSVSLQLLQVLVTVQSFSTDEHLGAKAQESVQSLCEAQGLNSVTQLYRQHMAQLLDWLSASVHTWSNYSLSRVQLHVVVVQSGPVIGEFVGQVMPLLRTCLRSDKDPELRLSIFTMLAKLLLDARNTLDSQGRFCDEAESFLCDILLPNLVWQAGRTAGAIRTAALGCLLALLHGGAFTPELLLSLEEKLRPPVLTALEEHSQTSRLFACRSLSTALRLIGNKLHPEALNKIYPELLKRLDDSSEDVRGAALQALGQWLSNLNQDYERKLLAPHLQLLFQQLLLHLDDPEASVQDHVLEVLKKGSRVQPMLLRQEVESVRDKHRSPLHCDQLLQHISSRCTDAALTVTTDTSDPLHETQHSRLEPEISSNQTPKPDPKVDFSINH